MPRISEAARLQAIERAWLAVKRQPNGATERELVERTGIQQRTLNNYLNELRDTGKIDKDGQLWFPLAYEETRIRAFDLTPEEAYALYLGSRLLVKQHDKRNQPAETALHKLAEVLTADAGVGQEIAQAAQQLAQRPIREDYQSIFTVLTRGYIYRRVVKLTYQTLTGQPFTTDFRTYLMEPSSIGHTTYAIGHSSLPGALRAYKIERILDATLTRTPYQIPPDFPGLDILNNAWTIFFGEETIRVLLRFSPRVKARVLETQWHPSQGHDNDPDHPGHLRWWANVADTTDMLPWIRGWGADCEVLEPADLRNKLIQATQSLAHIYGVAGISRTLDDRLLRCWGKTGEANEDFHPALFHMLDVGHVARELLGPKASPRWRRVLASALNADECQLLLWLPWVIALHDIGKVSALFQAQHTGQKQRLLQEGFVFPQPVGGFLPKLHHALLSRIALRQILETSLPSNLKTAILEMASGHHGVFQQDSKQQRNDLNMLNEDSSWAALRQRATSLLSTHLMPFEPDWPEPANVSSAVMALTGFAILCDWLGSDSAFFSCMPHMSLDDYILHSRRQARARVKSAGFMSPVQSDAPAGFSSLFPKFSPPRPLQASIDEISDIILARPTLTIVEAPTGEGKTEAAFALARRIGALHGSDEFYVALPTTATSNQMFVRVQKYLADQLRLATQARLIHGQAFLVEDELRITPLDNGTDDEHPALTWFTPKKQSLLAPFGVGTIDQAELAALNVRHNALRLIGLAGKVVILDEVHAYDVYMTTIIERMLSWLSALGASVILLSATLPAARRRALLDAFGTTPPQATTDAYPLLLVGNDHATQMLTPAAYQPARVITLASPPLVTDDDTAKAAWLLEQVSKGGCGCWITNTVQDAQRIFACLQNLAASEALDVDLLLAHARFPIEDRQSIEQAVMHRYGPKGQRPSRGIVVGTQVLEQSLDIDFDVMVTDLAPVDLLLQRAGRLHRHDRPNRSPAHNKPVLWIYAPLGDEGRPRPRHARIYAPYLQQRTWRALAQRTSLHLPRDYRVLLEEVYSETPPDPGDDLFPHWQSMIAAHQKHLDEAKLRIVNAPDAEESFSIGRDLQFREDEESSAWMVAQTRLGQESITIIPLEQLDETTARLFPRDEHVALDQPADRPTQYRLLQRSIRVSHFAIVNALRGHIEQSRLFRDAPLLKHVAPLWLTDGHAEFTWEGHAYIATLDTTLGLVIESKEQ